MRVQRLSGWIVKRQRAAQGRIVLAGCFDFSAQSLQLAGIVLEQIAGMPAQRMQALRVLRGVLPQLPYLFLNLLKIE